MFRAAGPGIGRPPIHAVSTSSPSSVRSVMSSWISTGMSSTVSTPVVRSTSVSAMIWPFPRESPELLAVLAARVRASKLATPSFTGRTARSTDIPSTAGRSVTRRPLTARWFRATAAAGSSSMARARVMSFARPAVTFGRRASNSASMVARSSSSRTTTLAATMWAAHSLIFPAPSSAVVRGIEVTSIRRSASSSEACLGAILRARPIWSAMPRPSSSRGTPRRFCSRI